VLDIIGIGAVTRFGLSNSIWACKDVTLAIGKKMFFKTLERQMAQVGLSTGELVKLPFK